MLIDTHCHLNLSEFNDDYREVATRAWERGVGINNVGCDLASSKRAVLIAEQFQDKPIWASVGQHPTDTGEDFNYKEYIKLTASKKVVAIGETGLDYYRLPKGPDREAMIRRQKELFFSHLDLAHEQRLPLIIHCRDAYDDLTELLMHRFATPSTHGVPSLKERGVMHCFAGSWRHAQEYMDLGFLISFTGIITFADQYDEVVRNTPLEKILVETDSPFLAPVPHRGKRNEPAHVVYVARRIAELKGKSYEEVVKITTQNAKRLFNLDISHV